MDSISEDQAALIRTRNFLDLRHESICDEDQQGQQLELEEGSLTPPPLDNDNQFIYANVDTQTSVQFEPQKEDCAYDENSRKTFEILRQLLAIERRRNEQRRNQNLSMKHYIKHLQADYLNLQRDLVDTLELGHKVKAQKEAQISTMEETLREKNLHIERLKETLDNLDETKLRDEFKELLAKQNQLSTMEKQQLKDQVVVVEQQLVRERVNNSQILQQFQQRLDDQMQSHDLERNNSRERITNLQSELERLLNEPSNLLIKEMRDERIKLISELNELQSSLGDSRSKYDSLRKKIELMLVEQEQMELRHQEEVDKLQEQQVEQRRLCNDSKLALEDSQEVSQILRFNLQRSERRVKNLLGAIRGNENTYKELINELNVKHEQELQKNISSNKVLERKLIEFESELDKKQNELVRFRLEQENELDSMRNDRDNRINKLVQEKLKVERQLQSIEMQLAHEYEDKELKCKLIEQLQKETKQFKEESKRLSIELAQSDAKLFAKQHELSQMINNQQTQQHELDQQQLNRFELEEAKKHAKRLETNIEELRLENEKLCMKLKLNESALSELGEAVKKEHSKLINEYETKLEQIQEEQSIYDRNKIRYKRYGYKLKKYCDHLRQVHEHLCSPALCGYIIGPDEENCQQSSTPPKFSIKRTLTSR